MTDSVGKVDEQPSTETSTSETITVRDHAHPCEHGSLWSHWIVMSKARWWQAPDCVGGREMALIRLDDGLWEEVRE